MSGLDIASASVEDSLEVVWADVACCDPAVNASYEPKMLTGVSSSSVEVASSLVDELDVACYPVGWTEVEVGWPSVSAGDSTDSS